MTAKNLQNFSVIGAGAWGTALAAVLAYAGRNVTVIARDPAVAAEINENSTNRKYLPNVPLPKMRGSFDVADCGAADAVLIAVPSQQIRTVCKSLEKIVADGVPVMLAAKGVELGTDLMLADVAREYFPKNPVAVLSGPNFADEVAAKLPAATTIACDDEKTGQALLQSFGSGTFRPYYTNDVAGVCFAGAAKNVIAIASGVVLGKKMGDNARAALVTRGLAELMRACPHFGADPKTLMGLSGMGDLMLTCYGAKSRNLRFGILLGGGKTANQALAELSSTVEGVSTAAALADFARRKKIDMPIVSAVDALITGKISLDDLVAGLLNRPLRQE